MKKSGKLSKEERQFLFKRKRLNYSARAIARELNRDHTTVLRELKRSVGVVDPHEDYYTQAEQAHQAAHLRRSEASRRKMRLKCREIRHYVEFHLSIAGWAPETIAGNLTRLGYPISAEAIYQYIHWERPDLKSCLPIAGKDRRRRRAGKHSHRRILPAADKRSIETLPEASKQRLTIGHFELDAIVGKRGGSGSVIQNKVDRKSRKIFLDKALSLDSHAYAELLIARMKRDVPAGILKTFLEDNGSEHAQHQLVDACLSVLSYFCHPYSACERGTVENRNKAIRRFLPKGTDFDDIPLEFLQWIEDHLNNMPMKVLGFKTPNQVWEEELKKAA
jgi:transposase, IS30 family